MSLAKISLLAAALVVGSTGVSADELLPGHVRQTVDPGPVVQRGMRSGLTVRVADVEPAAYLADAAAAAPGRANALTGVSLSLGPWSPALASAASAGQVDLSHLIDALNALGPTSVSVADYLALALPGLDNSRDTGSGSTPVDASKARSNRLPALFVDSAPIARVVPSAKAAPERTRPWALPPALSDPLTRYLVGAATLALLAGAGLRLALLTRRPAAQALARL